LVKFQWFLSYSNYIEAIIYLILDKNLCRKMKFPAPRAQGFGGFA